ncbi:MAG: tetratricopeptide repeat protein [Rubrivivax sp.]
MWHKTFVLLGMLFALGACTTAPQGGAPAAGFWQDQAFDYDAALVTVTERSLFALEPELLRSLRDNPAVVGGNQATRTAYLLGLIFGPDMKAFAYAGGHSTVAAETWRNQRGDCLSLSIMSLALARALDLRVQVQEVRVPVSIDRREGVDFFNAHVNLLVRNEWPVRTARHGLPPADIVIDFEPQPGSGQRGLALSDAAILARYLNNIAAEHLALGRDRLAYAHFKAAILADLGYAAPYSNLAQLYLHSGLALGAEALLRHALLLRDPSGQALGALHRLLLSQGRIGEALVYEQQLHSRRDKDPYHWLGLGLEHLQQARYAQAVEALERAQALTSGFEEVHRHLAIAYWRSGQTHKARDQLAILGALDSGRANVAKLGNKFNERPEAPIH